MSLTSKVDVVTEAQIMKEVSFDFGKYVQICQIYLNNSTKNFGMAVILPRFLKCQYFGHASRL